MKISPTAPHRISKKVKKNKSSPKRAVKIRSPKNEVITKKNQDVKERGMGGGDRERQKEILAHKTPVRGK